MTIAKIFGVSDSSDWSRPSVIALILANLIPVFGVLFLGWEVFPLLLLFWAENVVVGIFCALQILFISNPSLKEYHYPIWKQLLGKLFLILFFAFHFGAFTYAHGMALIYLFGRGSDAYVQLQDSSLMFYSKMHILLQTIPSHHLVWAVFGLFTSHAISFATDYIGKGQYRRAKGMHMFLLPYTRVGVMQLTVIGGAFLIALFKSPVWGLLLLVALKINLDLRAYLKTQRKLSVAGNSPA